MKCHRSLLLLLLIAVSASVVVGDADPDPEAKKPPPLLPPEKLLLEHRSAKPEPFLDRLASALFGTSSGYVE